MKNIISFLMLLTMTVILNNGEIHTYDDPVKVIRSEAFNYADGEVVSYHDNREMSGYGSRQIGTGGWVFQQTNQYDQIVDSNNVVQGIYPVGSVKKVTVE